MTSAVLFDLGNVLFRVDFMRAFAVWSEHSGVAVDELQRRFTVGESFHRFERGELEEVRYFEHLARELGIALSHEQWVYGWNSIFSGVVGGLEARLSTLAERLPIYAFTNTNATHQVVWEELYAELLKPFRKIYVSSQIGMRKPDVDAFRWVAQDIGVAAASVLFLDDHPDNVEGARAAGMSAVHIEQPHQVLDVIDGLIR